LQNQLHAGPGKNDHNYAFVARSIHAVRSVVWTVASIK
jgi:hypothetical protein